METAELDVALEELEVRLERLRALYEQYFMGLEKIEPAIARKDVDRRIYVLRREKIRNTAKRFKLQTIIQRYNTFQQYWQRICREIENGTYKRHLLRMQQNGTPLLTIAARKRLGRAGRASQPPEGKAASQPPVESPAPANPQAPAPANAPPPPPVDAQSPARAPANVPSPTAAAPAAAAAAAAPRPTAAKPAAPPKPAPTKFENLDLDMDFMGDWDPQVTRDRAPKPPAAPPKPAAAAATKTAAEPTSPARPAAVPPAPVAHGPSRPPLTPVRPLASRTPPSPRIPPASAPPKAVPKPAPLPAPRPLPAAAAPKPVVPPATPAPKPAAPPAAPKPAPAAAASAPAPKPATAAARAPAKPAATDTGNVEDARLRDLHTRLQQAKQQTKEANVSFEGLARSVRAAEAKLREQHKNRKIDFDVVIKDGKAIVKPIVR